MINMDSRILVTGASGFIGTYILRSLIKAGYTQLVCLSRKEKQDTSFNQENVSIQWVQGDVTDILFLEQCLEHIDCIIHCAAQVSFDTRQKRTLIRTATEGTANLVNIAMDKNVKYFLHVSSVAALGRKNPDEIITEKSIFSHSMYDTTYGLSKFLAEQEVWRAHAEGLRIAILNPSMVLGSGNWHQSSPQIFKKTFMGLSYYPIGSTGWVDVRDVADAVLRTLNVQPNGERFIISSQNITYQQIFEQIANNLGVKAPNHPLQTRFGAWKWRIESFRSYFLSKESQLTKETYQSTSVNSVYQNDKSKDMLGMSYRPVEETISHSCQLFLESFSERRQANLLP